MKRDDFYRFEESSENVVGYSNGRSKVTPAKVFIGFLIVALAVALIAVVIYYNTGERKTKLEGNVASPTDEQIASPASTTLTSPIFSTDASMTSTSPTALTSPTAPSTEELNKRIDCIPEATGQYVNVTEDLCRKRNCIFDRKDYGNGAPLCFFATQKTGYRVSRCQDTKLGFKCDLQLKGQGPFGLDLNIMEFEVQMLGDDIVRFKVRMFLLLFKQLES